MGSDAIPHIHVDPTAGLAAASALMPNTLASTVTRSNMACTGAPPVGRIRILPVALSATVLFDITSLAGPLGWNKRPPLPLVDELRHCGRLITAIAGRSGQRLQC